MPTDISATLASTILQFDSSGFDATRVFSPTVTLVGGTYVMLYGGLPFANNIQIGLATSSDNLTWTKFSTDPVISNAGSSGWDSFREVPVTLLYENGTYELWFTGSNTNLSTDPGAVGGFGYATSVDGINWTQQTAPIRVGPTTSISPSLDEVVKLGAQYHVYYFQQGSVYHAVSADGINFTGDVPVSGLPAGANLVAATTTEKSGSSVILAVFAAADGSTFYADSSDGLSFTVEGNINLPSGFGVSDIRVENGTLQLYGTTGVGNVNWSFGNTVIQYATAELPADFQANHSPLVDAGHSNLTADLYEQPNVRGSTSPDVATGIIAFSDPDATDRPTATVVKQVIKYQSANGDTVTDQLSDTQLAALKAAFSMMPEAANANSGKLDWSYDIIDKSLDFLGIGETLTVTSTIEIDDGRGGKTDQDVTVTLHGSNDAPVVTPVNAIVHDGATVTGPKVTDPDIHDTVHVTAASTRGHSIDISTGPFTEIDGRYGELFLYADGSFSYVADSNRAIPRNGGTDIFQYSVTDGHSAAISNTLTFQVLPEQHHAPAPDLIAYPIFEPDGSPLQTIIQGNRSDPDVFVNGNGQRHHENDHLENTAFQWSYDFQPPEARDPHATTQIHSVSNGKVIFVEDNLSGDFWGYGNVVTVESTDAAGNTYYATYAHLKEGTTSLAVGQTIFAGDVIGALGDTGTYDGTSHPHLHIQFGTETTAQNLVTKGYDSGYANHSLQGIVADGASDNSAPAYFQALTMHYDQAPNTADRAYVGTQGIDTFYANGLGDTVTGLGGGDVLFAGAGRDSFKFLAASDSRPGTGNFDTITGFVHGSDSLDFSTIDGLNGRGPGAAAIHVLQSTPSTLAAHSINIVTINGDTIVYANAGAAAESVTQADIEVHLKGFVHLSASDFILH